MRGKKAKLLRKMVSVVHGDNKEFQKETGYQVVAKVPVLVFEAKPDETGKLVRKQVLKHVEHKQLVPNCHRALYQAAKTMYKSGEY